VPRELGSDWAFEPDEVARSRLERKEGSFRCAELGRYIAENDPWAAYHAIRDAALFDDSSCAEALARLRRLLDEKPVTRVALHFYEARRGSREALAALVSEFDADAIDQETGSSRPDVVVSLFGFLPDWDQTGRRLLRYRKYSDAHASEMVAAALEWKRFLFGRNPDYREKCLEAARLEGMIEQAQRLCSPDPP